MLIEFLVVAVLMALLGVVLLTVYKTVLNSLAIITAKSVVTSQFRSAVEQFGRDVEAAQAFPATCGGGVYNASSTVVLLDIPGSACIVYQCVGGLCTSASPGRLERLIVGTPPTRVLVPLSSNASSGMTLMNCTRLTNSVTCRWGLAQTVQRFRVESKMMVMFTRRR